MATLDSYEEFQDWLRDEMDARLWTQARLAREIGVFKGTVGRWLMPVEDANYRKPSTRSFLRLAELFGVDPVKLMSMAGLDAPDASGRTALQRDVISIVDQLPDETLVVVYPQLRGLLEQQVQRKERQARDAKEPNSKG